LDKITAYLYDFLKRGNPLVNVDRVTAKAREEFAERFNSTPCTVQGWEKPTYALDLYVRETDKLFSNVNVQQHHLGSK